MSFGEKLKKARKTKGLTLKELGDSIGVTHSALSQIENNKNEVSRKTMIALAKVLGDNFGDSTLDEHITVNGTAPPSKKELAREMSVEQLISLKFGGGGETRSKADMRALARLLDAEIAKEERIMGYPERKKK